MWAISRVGDHRTVSVAVCLVLAAVLGVMVTFPFEPARMGDYADYGRDFQLYFSPLRFQFHLSAAILRGFHALYGSSPRAGRDAFDVLTRAASAVFVAGLAAFAFFRGFSAQGLRYLAVVMAAPPTLLLFGYHELGYLPGVFIASAIPLALVGLEDRRETLVIVAALLLGVGTALHGFGLVACGFMFLLVLVWQLRLPRETRSPRLPAKVAGAILVGWLVWLPLWFIGFGWSVSASDSAHVTVRPLFHTTRDAYQHRLDYAIFSHLGLRDILFEFLILGVFASLVVFVLKRDAMWWAVVTATIPCVLYVIFYWPVQGLGNDTDFLGSAFPALYGVGWLASRSSRWSLAVVAVLCLCQLALLHVVRGTTFVHARDF